MAQRSRLTGSSAQQTQEGDLPLMARESRIRGPRSAVVQAQSRDTPGGDTTERKNNILSLVGRGGCGKVRAAILNFAIVSPPASRKCRYFLSLRHLSSRKLAHLDDLICTAIPIEFDTPCGMISGDAGDTARRSKFTIR